MKNNSSVLYVKQYSFNLKSYMCCSFKSQLYSKWYTMGLEWLGFLVMGEMENKFLKNGQKLGLNSAYNLHAFH